MSDQKQAEEAYRPLPVPENAPDPPDDHFKLGRLATGWWYTDPEGVRLFRVCRFDDDTGGKQVLPQTWDGAKWRWKAWPDPRPLYGLAFASEDSTRPVVVVEGEKTADALQHALGEDFAVVTWPGGSRAVRKADWSSVMARDVILWPDADEAGFAAMTEVSAKLRAQLCQCATVVVRGRPKGWDAADATVAERQSMVRETFADLQARKAIEAAAAERSIGAWNPWADDAPPVSDPHDLPPYEGDWRHIAGGKPLASMLNLRLLLEHYKIRPRANVITKTVEYHGGPGTAYSRHVSLADIISLTSVNQLPTKALPDMVSRLAMEDEYNPIAEWLGNQRWDGRDRLQPLCDSLGIAQGDAFSRLLVRRWMLTAIAVAVEPEPPTSQGVLVLQGPQGLGKSRWLGALSGEQWFRGGHILDTKVKDSVWEAITAWIVELGELDATIRRSDIAALKGFVTKNADTFRRPYEAVTYKFTRRTVFAATVNPDTFLHDPTGNRRYWVIRCGQVNPSHGVDMRQAWLQALHLYRSGEPHYLTSEETAKLSQRNSAHTEVTAEEDLILSKWNFAVRPTNGPRMTAAEVALAVGYDRPSTATCRVVGQVLRRIIGPPKTSNGRTWWEMPPVRTEADRAMEAPSDPNDPAPF